MEFVLITLLILILILVYEYRLRKPDQIVIYEHRGEVGIRKTRFYARHFSMPIAKTSYSFVQTIDASAKGNIDIRVKVAVTVAASLDHLAVLLKVGGWSVDAVTRTAKELEILLLGYVKEYTELNEIEAISSDKIRDHLHMRIQQSKGILGLEIIALTIASFEPINPQIAEALRQREHARILEQTEKLNQGARIAAAKARLRADEEIALLENELELKKFGLKQALLEKESALAESRVEHELELKKMQLDYEKDELRLLKDSPELLLLTPQAARLAEASQSLKNARTVISLASGDGKPGGDLLEIFSTFLLNALDTFKKRKEK